MPGGILVVQTRPRSPEDAAAYHEWYEGSHIPEMLGVDGFTTARRFAAIDGEWFLAIYEIDGDIETAKANLASTQASGSMSAPVGVQLDPPPTVQYFRAMP